MNTYEAKHRRPVGELSPILKAHLAASEAERQEARDKSRDLAS